MTLDELVLKVSRKGFNYRGFNSTATFDGVRVRWRYGVRTITFRVFMPDTSTTILSTTYNTPVSKLTLRTVIPKIIAEFRQKYVLESLRGENVANHNPGVLHFTG